MGKLIDSLLKSAKSTGSSIGFTGQNPQSKIKAVALILSAKNIGEAKLAADAGADVLVVPPEIDAKELASLDIVWGMDLRSVAAVSQQQQRTYLEQGANFLLFGPQTQARTLAEPIEHCERVLIIDPPKDDPLLLSYRTYNDINVDVVVIDTKLSPADLQSMTVAEFARIRSWNYLMRFPTVLTLTEVPAEGDIITSVKIGPQALWLLHTTPESLQRVKKELEQIPREKDSPVMSASFSTGMEQRKPNA